MYLFLCVCYGESYIHFKLEHLDIKSTHMNLESNSRKMIISNAAGSHGTTIHVKLLNPFETLSFLSPILFSYHSSKCLTPL